jgi:hypothetical protein
VSLPGACAGCAETQGAYRLFRQESFDWLDILEPHPACMMRRMAPHPAVLCIQDTIGLDFNSQQISGAGAVELPGAARDVPTSDAGSQSRARAAGVLDTWMWAREPEGDDGTRAGEKESRSWVEGCARVAEMADQIPQTPSV